MRKSHNATIAKVTTTLKSNGRKLHDADRDRLHKRIADAWGRRAKLIGATPGSAKFLEAQAHFFVGAMSALVVVGIDHGQAMPPQWVVGIMSDDDLRNAVG